MQELINVTVNDNQQQVVSARDLYKALGIKKRFSAWFAQYSDMFTEGHDFMGAPESTPIKNGNGRIQYLDDYVLTIKMAEHIAMMTKTDRGREVREYFIQLQEKWNDPQKVMARALILAQKELDTLRIELEEQKPLVNFANAVSTSEDSILIGDFAKLISQNGVKIGQNRLFKWLRQKGFLISRKGESWNMPKQEYLDRGLFEVKESTAETSGGLVKLYRTTKITGKGQVYFSDLILNDDTLWVK